MRQLPVLAFLLLIALPSSAATLLVAQDGSGDFLTIGDAVAAASSGDTIDIEGGIYAEEINPSGKDLSLRAADSGDPVTIDGEGARRCLVGASGETLVLTDMRFTDGFTDQDGGCVLLSDAVATFTNCQFDDCEAVDGGGLWLGPAGTVTLTGCTFSACDAESRGGGLHVEGGTATLDGSLLWDNFCGLAGGALAVMDSGGPSSVTVTSSSLQSNFGVGLGEAIWSDSSAPILIDGTQLCDHDAGVEVSGSLTDGGGNSFGEWCCQGDVDWDGDVDGFDVDAMLTAWGNSLISADDREDVARDGDVDVEDLLLLLQNWGMCQ